MIGCSAASLAGWESGRRARVDSAYALKLVRVMPELNYVDLVTRPEGPAPKPPEGELARGEGARDRGDGPRQLPPKLAVAKAVRAFDDERGRGYARQRIAELLHEAAEWADPGAKRVLRSTGQAESRGTGEPRRFALGPEAERILGLLGKGKLDDAREKLEQGLDELYEWRIPLYRWMLAHVLLAQGDSQSASKELRRIGGEFEGSVRELIAEARRRASELD